jgi:hypothetical protein
MLLFSGVYTLMSLYEQEGLARFVTSIPEGVFLYSYVTLPVGVEIGEENLSSFKPPAKILIAVWFLHFPTTMKLYARVMAFAVTLRF